MSGVIRRSGTYSEMSGTTMNDPCVLIPSYNESGTIGALVKKLKSRGFTVYVVDDGSADDTSGEAARGGAILIRHRTNRGKGAALRTGFERVLADGWDSVVAMDGDGQHDADDIANLKSAMERSKAGIVIGNRMFGTGKMPALRVYTNRFMSGLLSWIAGQDIPDSQCGFRLIKCEVLRKIRLDSSNYEIESEMIVKTARAGFFIASAPIRSVYAGEPSRINPFIDTLRFMAFVFRAAIFR